MLQVDMEVDDFASFIFLKNKNDAIIELSLGGVENMKDMFCFLVDLLCKGLVLLFAKETYRIEIDELSINDFQLLKKKMSLAGIDVKLNMLQNTDHIPPSINIRDIDFLPDNEPLDTYVFRVVSLTFIYEIRFAIIQPIR